MCNDCKRYVFTDDYDFVKNSGYEIRENVKEDSETNTKKESYTNVNILDSRLQQGIDYSVYYTNPKGEYRTALGTCNEDGKLSVQVCGEDGDYTLCLITETNDSSKQMIYKNPKCTISDGQVQIKKFDSITTVVKNDILKPIGKGLKWVWDHTLGWVFKKMEGAIDASNAKKAEEKAEAEAEAAEEAAESAQEAQEAAEE